MSEILSIEKLREMATSVIDIPDFNNEGTIKVKVRKPRLMAMAAQGKIPNHLISITTDMIVGRSSRKKEEPQIKDVASMMELYCQACLVEPSYDEFKDIMTDTQMNYIFNWAMGRVNQLDNFRKDKEDGTSDNTSEQVEEKTE